MYCSVAQETQHSHTPVATEQLGFCKKIMSEYPEKVLYPKRKAMLHSTTLS